MADITELKGVVEKIFDARAMKVGDTRIGAPWKKNLSDVVTGGTLAEGQTVVVQYSVNGKWNNAESIQIVGAAPANAATAGDFDPSEKGGKHNRFKRDYRHPDEITRVEMLKVAVGTLTANGILASSPDTHAAVIEVTKLAELYQAFVEDVVDAAFIAEKLGGKAPQPAAQAAEPAPEPSPEAQAAEAASTQPGPTESATDPLAAWMAGG
ncbi:MAG: hypothetical protein GY906_27840 [bacterium]|nr:hypothetical protein [bacterium]